VRAGLAADRLGPAFLAGYRAAIDALVPGLGGEASLAVTEDGPVHPARITTRFDGAALHGTKRFVTGVPGATRLVVLATAGTEGDRQRLVAVVVDPDGPGIAMARTEPTPFVPEVPHAVVTFAGTPALRVVPGDGWADVVRPFRTVEDLHVLGAIHGFLLGAAARAGFGEAAVCALGASLASIVTLSACDPSAPGVHTALAGVLESFASTAHALSWERAEPVEVACWKRDLPLLSVASKAREARLRTAFAALEGR
jgi:alkylation response protein AidB-like acyl-CoA dehydrogenase